MKNLVRLSVHFSKTESKAAHQFAFIIALASQSEKLELIELHHEDKLDEHRLENLIVILGKTFKRLECPKWNTSPHFAANHLVPGSSFRDLESLTFDGSLLPLNILVQIAQFPKLKKLTINLLFDLTQDLLIQTMSVLNLNKMESFVSLSHQSVGTDFNFEKGRSNFSDLSQVLRFGKHPVDRFQLG